MLKLTVSQLFLGIWHSIVVQRQIRGLQCFLSSIQTEKKTKFVSSPDQCISGQKKENKSPCCELEVESEGKADHWKLSAKIGTIFLQEF